MITYEVITSSTAQGLDAQIKQRVIEGWEPQGGVAVCVDPSAVALHKYTWAVLMAYEDIN